MTEEVQSAAPAEAVVEPQEAITEQTPETTPEPQQEPEKQKQPDWQRSINRLTRQKYQLQARLEEMERRIAEQPKAPPSITQPQGAPKIEDFQDFDAYIRASSRWEADQIIKERLTEREQAARQYQAQEYEASLAKNWSKRLESAVKEIPDLHDVLETAVDIPMPPSMREASN